MRDLFRLLYRIRDTILFLALMIMAMLLLHGGNAHHRAQAISSSNALVGTIFTWRKSVTDYANLKKVNQDLADENAAWRSRHESAYTPVEDLFVRINDTIQRQQYSYITAKVVNSTWHKQKNYITLDKGATSGVQEEMGVIGPNGIVGVVREVSPHFASIISILSPTIRTSVNIRRTGHFGLLYWDTNDAHTASVIDIAKHARVLVGDTVETRGGDGTFPAGIPVGVIETLEAQPGSNYHEIRIRLTEDMTRGGYVYVVKDLERSERDSIQKAHLEP